MLKKIESLILIIIVGLASGCSSILYYPVKGHQFYKPSQFGLKEEDVWLTVSKNKKLHGWWIESTVKPSKGTFIFFHGNAENLTSHFANLSWLPAKGYSYFIFDYPGYGLSEGKPTPEANVEAGMAAMEWLSQKVDKKPIYVYGQSMGGIVALRSVYERKEVVPIKAVIIDASFMSFHKIGRHKLSLNWPTWIFQPLVYVLLSDKWAAKHVDEISPIPMLIMHGQADQVVEPRFGEELYEAAKEPKEIWRIPNGKHGDTFWNHNKQYQAKLLDWLSKH
ncbi:MAG: alpha/beta hydrolase [Bdellovibrionota bacterium]